MPSARRPDTAPPAPRGALVVRLCNWVGEVVLSMPTLRRLEAGGFELHLVGKGWAPALLAGSGWPVSVRPHGLAAASSQLRALRRTLTVPGRPPPRALLLTKSLSSALEAWLARLPAAGYARDGRSLLLKTSYPLPRFAHASHAFWHLANRLLGEAAPYPTVVALEPSREQETIARRLLAERGLEPGRYVLLCPFSGPDDRDRRKVWPGFAALTAALASRAWPVVVCPGPGEEPLAAATLPTAVPLCGVDLGEYAALLRLAATVVANDTGPGHLAAAVGARLISLYGAQSVAAWAPLGPRVTLMHEPPGWPGVDRVLAQVLAS